MPDNPLASIKDSELSHALYLKGVEQADAEAVWIEYDKNREALLVSLADEIVTNEKISYTQAKDRARNTEMYKTFITGMAEAKKSKIIARVKYSSVDAEIRLRLNRGYMSRRELNSGSMDT